MKKLLLSILLLIPFWVNAQVYHPLVDSGVVWNVEASFFDGQSQTGETSGEKFFTGGDTMIEGLHYLKLMNQPTYYYTFSGNGGFISGGNFTDQPQLIGALREDAARKVWFRKLPCSYINLYNFPLNSDTLLYDFGLQLGDTFFVAPNNYTIVVTAVDSIQLLNGEWRRRLTLNAGWESPYWIEQLGSDAGLLTPLLPNYEGGSNLSCYHLNNELLYGGTGSIYINYISCDAIDAVSYVATSLFQFTVLPIPVTDFLSINFTSPNFSTAQLKITNVLGQELMHEKIESGSPLQIPVAKFSSNHIIFCQLWRDGELMSVKKVLIAF